MRPWHENVRIDDDEGRSKVFLPIAGLEYELERIRRIWGKEQLKDILEYLVKEFLNGKIQIPKPKEKRKRKK